MTDPMTDIENRQGNIDMGKLAVQIYQGAKSETDNWLEAFWATVAFFAGMFRNAQDPPHDD